MCAGLHVYEYRHAPWHSICVEVRKQSQVLVTFYLFRTGSLIDYHWVHKIIWPIGFQGYSWKHILSCCRSTGITDVHNHSGFYVDSGDLNLGPHTCTATALAIVQSHQLQFYFFKWKLARSMQWDSNCTYMEMFNTGIWKAEIRGAADSYGGPNSLSYSPAEKYPAQLSTVTRFRNFTLHQSL